MQYHCPECEAAVEKAVQQERAACAQAVKKAVNREKLMFIPALLFMAFLLWAPRPFPGESFTIAIGLWALSQFALPWYFKRHP